MSCALCPEYHFCELKKSGLDKNATFIVDNIMWACNPEIEKRGSEYVVSPNDVYLRVKIEDSRWEKIQEFCEECFLHHDCPGVCDDLREHMKN